MIAPGTSHCPATSEELPCTDLLEKLQGRRTLRILLCVKAGALSTYIANVRNGSKADISRCESSRDRLPSAALWLRAGARSLPSSNHRA
jgi:hypothetical protein